MNQSTKGKYFWLLMIAVFAAMVVLGIVNTSCLETVKKDTLLDKGYFLTQIKKRDGTFYSVNIPSELPDFVKGKKYQIRRKSADFAYLDYGMRAMDHPEIRKCFYNYHFLVTWYNGGVLALVAHVDNGSDKYWEYMNGIPILTTEKRLYEIIDKAMKRVPKIPLGNLRNINCV